MTDAAFFRHIECNWLTNTFIFFIINIIFLYCIFLNNLLAFFYFLLFLNWIFFSTVNCIEAHNLFILNILLAIQQISLLLQQIVIIIFVDIHHSLIYLPLCHILSLSHYFHSICYSIYFQMHFTVGKFIEFAKDY